MRHKRAAMFKHKLAQKGFNLRSGRSGRAQVIVASKRFEEADKNTLSTRLKVSCSALSRRPLL